MALLTDPSSRHPGRPLLKLVSAANDLDGFVEIERDRRTGYVLHYTLCILLIFASTCLNSTFCLSCACRKPLLCQGGRSGGSYTNSRFDNCGVYIGRWRPNSQPDPRLRPRVAVKVMEKGVGTNLDIQHLVRMDFPYVNHFLGQFASSQQLDVKANSALTIMVSSYCPGGDHWSAITRPISGSSMCAVDMMCSQEQDGCFCFTNPHDRAEVVNHTMTDVVRDTDTFCVYETFSYVCVGSDTAQPGNSIICRVQKINERYFKLFSSAPPCLYGNMTPTDVSSFNIPFQLAEPSAKCFLIYAQIQDTKITQVWKIMPRPNVAFIRAFSAQLLRALGYCHSRKLTSHNGEGQPSVGAHATT
jgi:hypothetical protein